MPRGSTKVHEDHSRKRVEEMGRAVCVLAKAIRKARGESVHLLEGDELIAAATLLRRTPLADDLFYHLRQLPEVRA